MAFSPFLLERFYNDYEFSVPYQLSSSDCESYTIEDLLLLEDGAQERFLKLRLGYIEPQGETALREVVASLYNGAEASDILITTGAEEGILLFMRALLERGEHVVVQYPAFQSLYEIARDLGCEVTAWTMEETDANEWSVDIGRLRDLIKSNTKAIVINSPHNPTGHVITAGAMANMASIARLHGVYIFSDEVYRFLEHRVVPAQPAVDTYERAVSLGVMSKAFGLAGIRIGWLVTKDKSLMRRMLDVKYYTTICSSGPSEFLARLALRHKDCLLDRNRRIIAQNVKRLKSVFGNRTSLFCWSPPEGGSTTFPRLVRNVDSDEFCRKAREEKGVLLVPSTVFHFGSRHFRIGCGRADFPDAVARFESYITSMR